MRRTVGILAVIGLAVALLPGVASATFPGDNGKVVFEEASGLAVVEPDGTGKP